MQALGGMLALGIAFGEQALWEQHMKEANGFEEAGRYTEAKVAYQLALKDEETPSDSGFRKASTCNNLALLQRYLGHYSEARREYQCAIEWFENARGSGSPEYATALHNLAALDYLEGRLDEA